jgi:hypothetical protein
VVLLGSAALLVQQGLSERLGGRLELIRTPHWSFGEMRDAFGFSLDQFVYFGGCPGAAGLVADEERWAAYVLDSIVETTATPEPRSSIGATAAIEVDFVVQRGDRPTAIEVKSGRRRDGLPGMAAFAADDDSVRRLLVGGDGTPLESFLASALPVRRMTSRPTAGPLHCG